MFLHTWQCFYFHVNHTKKLQEAKPQLKMSNKPKCEFCGCENENCLAQCIKTGLYFCNGKGDTKSSHIIHYLKKMHFDQVHLPDTNCYSKVQLQCYVCGSTNIFNLGLLSSKDKKKAYIACRSPCQFDKKMVDEDVDNSTFQSFVSNGELKIIQVPKDNEYQKVAISRTMAVIDSIKDKLGMKTKENESKNGILSAKMRYNSREDFYDILVPFVNLEREQSNQLENSRKFTGVNLHWENDTLCSFKATPTLFRSISLGVSLAFTCDDITEIGTVIKMSKNMNTEVKFKVPSLIAKSNHHVTISIMFNSIPFDRQLEALRIFKDKPDCMNDFIASVILGNIDNYDKLNRLNKKKIYLSQPGGDFPKLNRSQEKCATIALSQRFSLIQGPPGTGKTTVIAALAYSFVKAGIKPVLLCAQSNVATDFLTKRVAETGIRVCRVLSSVREQIDADIEKYTTKHLVAERYGEDIANYDERDVNYKKLTKKEIEVVSQSDVVCSTCTCAGGARISGVRAFKVVIFDESGQCVDPDILIPLVHGAQQVILVGDHKQLGPVITSSQCQRARYDIPIMQRLILQGIHPSVLRIQYRMHPGIAAFASSTFYNNMLRNGVSEEERTWENQFMKWPNPNVPMFFWNVNSQEEIYEDGLSFVNTFEAGCIFVLLDAMWKHGIQGSDIGIITPYAGQQAYLLETIQQKCSITDPDFFDDIEIASVDAFQGHEKNFIILSNVRANDSKDIGFLKDERRLCVSLTRAKYGLIVIGCANTFSDNKLWCKYIEYCKSIGVFVEGPLNELVPSEFVPTYSSNKSTTEEDDKFY